MTDFLDQLDVVLPYYVDYLAALDHDEAEGITDCGSAVVHLVKNGIQKNVFVRDAEMTFTERGIVLRRSGVDRVRKLWFLGVASFCRVTNGNRDLRTDV